MSTSIHIYCYYVSTLQTQQKERWKIISDDDWIMGHESKYTNANLWTRAKFHVSIPNVRVYIYITFYNVYNLNVNIIHIWYARYKIAMQVNININVRMYEYIWRVEWKRTDLAAWTNLVHTQTYNRQYIMCMWSNTWTQSASVWYFVNDSIMSISIYIHHYYYYAWVNNNKCAGHRTQTNIASLYEFNMNHIEYNKNIIL